jgi:hypothetical protein
LGDSKDDGDNDGITPAHGHMLKSLHGHFGRDTINKYCKDGDC